MKRAFVDMTYATRTVAKVAAVAALLTALVLPLGAQVNIEQTPGPAERCVNLMDIGFDRASVAIWGDREELSLRRGFLFFGDRMYPEATVHDILTEFAVVMAITFDIERYLPGIDQSCVQQTLQMFTVMTEVTVRRMIEEEEGSP